MQRMCIARYIIWPCLLGCRWMVHFLKPAFNNRTSAQSNLTAGRIAAAHGRFNGICKMCKPQKHASLCRPESKSQTTASRSVQPFLHSSRQTVVILHNGPPSPLPYNCPFLLVIWTNPHLIHSSLGPPKSPTQRTSRLVQAFLHSSQQSVPILYDGPPLPPFELPILTGDLHLHLTRGSLGPPDPSTQTVFRLVQPFLQGSLLWRTDSQATLLCL